MPAKKTNATYVAELLNTEYEALEPYILSKTKILHKHIICGYEWLIRPHNILGGKGCPKCSKISQTKTHEQYEKEVSEDYQVLQPYINSYTKILHKHLVCGHEWIITPNHILSGQGCPECGGTRKKTHEEYEKELSSTEYEVLEPYTTNAAKILHKHIICGHEWLVSPNSILSGKGCPECASKNSNIVYILNFPELDLYKVGITNNLARRVTQFGYTCSLLFAQEYENGSQAYNIEQQILDWLVDRLVNTGKLASGNTETFRW